MQKKICVLLTTYNPNRYLLEQLDSIFTQKGVECKVIIRDDASPRKEYLYMARDRYNVCIIEGEKNVGVANNIRELLRYAYEHEKDYDYFSYGDQDDVWMPDKLATAISALETLDDSLPCLYYSNLLVTDENLTPSHELFRRNVVCNTCRQSLAQVFLFACTSVFNYQMIAAIRNMDFQQIGFDSCLYYFGIWKGNAYFDDIPHIFYRQHGNNLSGVKKKGINYILEKMKSNTKHREKDFQQNAKFIMKYFDIPETHQEYKILKLVAEYSNIFDRMKIAFHIRAGYYPKDLYRLLHLIIGSY